MDNDWSYTSGISDIPLLGLTIGDMFDRTVEKYPDHPALIVTPTEHSADVPRITSSGKSVC